MLKTGVGFSTETLDHDMAAVFVLSFLKELKEAMSKIPLKRGMEKH